MGWAGGQAEVPTRMQRHTGIEWTQTLLGTNWSYRQGHRGSNTTAIQHEEAMQPREPKNAQDPHTEPPNRREGHPPD